MDVIDVQQTFSILLAEPPIPEGQAAISGINAPTEAQAGEAVPVSAVVRTDGGEDTIFAVVTDTDAGAVVGERQEAVLASGSETTFSWSLIMPDRQLNLELSAGHIEG